MNTGALWSGEILLTWDGDSMEISIGIWYALEIITTKSRRENPPVYCLSLVLPSVTFSPGTGTVKFLHETIQHRSHD